MVPEHWSLRLRMQSSQGLGSGTAYLQALGATHCTAGLQASPVMARQGERMKTRRPGEEAAKKQSESAVQIAKRRGEIPGRGE
jgi:hypothetical protein